MKEKKRFWLPKKIIKMLHGEEKTSMPVGVLTTKTIEDVDQETLVENIGEYIKKHNLNIFVGPEFLFMPKDRLYTKQEKDTILRKLAEFTKGKEILLIPGTIMWEDDKNFYNTAPVIANGEILGEYHKQTDWGSSKRAKERGSVKEQYFGTDPGIYDWNNLKVGVEVCSDYGKLKKGLPKSDLDLYVIPSCKFDYGPIGKMTEGDYAHAPPMGKKGYIFYSDGWYGRSVVSPNYPDEMTPTSQDRELNIYELPDVKNRMAPSLKTLMGYPPEYRK